MKRSNYQPKTHLCRAIFYLNAQKGWGFLLLIFILLGHAPLQAQLPPSPVIDLIRSKTVTLGTAPPCIPITMADSSCCQGLATLPGFVASGGMIVDDSRDRLYAADFENNRVQVFDSNSFQPITIFSSMSSHGFLNLPVDEALDAAGNIYVADLGNKAVEKFDPNYNYICSIGNNQGLSIVGVWASGNSVYFSTMQNYIYQYNGSGSSYSAAATFGSPTYINHPNELIQVGSCLYVTDTYGSRILKFQVNQPSPIPVIVKDCLDVPTGIRTDAAGNFIVEESNNGSYPAYVDVFSPDFQTLERRCTLNDTWSAVVNAAGNVFVSGMNSSSVTVLQGCGSGLTPTPSATPLFQTPTVTPTPVTALLQKAVAAPSLSKNGQPIQFVVTLGQPGLIRLCLYTPTGELIYQTQVQGQPGTNSLQWLLQNRAGRAVASGLYLYVLQVTGPSGSTISKGQVVVLH
jgi:hypothetical protein